MEITQKQTFDAALEDFVAEMERVANRYHQREDGLPSLYVTTYETTRGPKYVKVMRVETGKGAYRSRSYAGFVRLVDGAVLYAGGPKPFIGKSEATTVRGNIFDARTWVACVGPYGVRTIR